MGKQRLDEGRRIGDKIEVGLDASRFAKFSAHLSNILSTPERVATKLVLGKEGRENGRYPSERRRALAHIIGAVAGTGSMLLGAGILRHVAESYVVGTAEAKPIGAGSYANGDLNSQASPVSSSTHVTETTSTGSTSAAPNTLPLSIDANQNGISDLVENPANTGGSSFVTPPPAESMTGSTTSQAPEAGTTSSVQTTGGKAGYNRFENHEGDHMAVVDKEFDWKNATPEAKDIHIRETIANRPDLLASAMETREHGRLGFSEARVNARIREYSVPGKNGEWSAKGLKDLEIFKKDWNNGKTIHEMSSREVRDLQSRYDLVNHGTSEGQFKNAIDDKVSIAKSLNFRPELGDRFVLKHNGDGTVDLIKINVDPDHQDRSCDNWTTLRKRVPVVNTPVTSVPETPHNTSPPLTSHPNRPSVTHPPVTKPPVTHPPITKPPTAPVTPPATTPTPVPTPAPAPAPAPAPDTLSHKGPIGADLASGHQGLAGATYGNDAPELHQTAGAQLPDQAQQQATGGAAGSDKLASDATQVGSGDTQKVREQASTGAATAPVAVGKVGE